MNKLYTLLLLILSLLLIKRFLPILLNMLSSKNFTIETPSIISSKYLSSLSKKEFIGYCIKTLEALNFNDVVHLENTEPFWLVAYKNNIKYLILCIQSDDTEPINLISINEKNLINILIGFAYLNDCNNISIISNHSIDKTSLEGNFPTDYIVEIIDGTSMFSTLNTHIFDKDRLVNL